MKHVYTPEDHKRIEEIAEKHGITTIAVKKRLFDNFYDFSKVDFPNQRKRTKYYYNGRPALDVAREHNIKEKTFGQRIRNGWSIERACTFREPRLKEIALKTGLTCNQVYNLVYKKRIAKEDVLCQRY
jgi:hypothetical protein